MRQRAAAISSTNSIFEVGAGLELRDAGFEKGLPFLLGFSFEDDALASCEAVFCAVLRDSGFAFSGDGSAGYAAIAAGCFDLRWCSHASFRLVRGSGRGRLVCG